MEQQQFGIGPQYRQDSPFTARMRYHQSWYRANVLHAPYGTGPRRSNKTLYGNMLTWEDGAVKGLNFIRPHIFEVAKRRVADGTGMVDEFRLFCNMLSSQPMCFNLFGPLVDNVELATQLFRLWLPGEIERVGKVRLEYAPEPAKEYLNDRTAFDAFVEYTRPDGTEGFIGIETKLTEPLSQKFYALPAYTRWTEASNSPWPQVSWPRLKEMDINQIWRDHLLAVALLRHPQSRYAAGHFLVVHHPLDESAAQALKKYQMLLKPDDETYAALPLDQLVELWSKTTLREADQGWLSGFSKRYLDLSGSEEDYRAFIEERHPS